MLVFLDNLLYEYSWRLGVGRRLSGRVLKNVAGLDGRQTGASTSPPVHQPWIRLCVSRPLVSLFSAFIFGLHSHAAYVKCYSTERLRLRVIHNISKPQGVTVSRHR